MFVESVFFISFAGIVLMLGFKFVEEKVGTIGWWSRLIETTDVKAHAWREHLAERVRLWKKIVHLFVFEFLPAMAYRQTLRLKDYFYKKYYESNERFRGEKRLLRSNGSVSEFLQNISKGE